MSVLINETTSALEGTDSKVETRPIGYSDWYMPERLMPVEGETSLRSNEESSEGLATRLHVKEEYSRPIRKSALVVPLSGDTVKVIQHWECIILEVRDDCVCCEMHDLTDEKNPVEYAEIFISEFNEYDRALLDEGTVFYWSVGNIRRSNGQIKKNSEIHLRRLPKLTKRKTAEIARKVDSLRELFNRE